MSDAESTRSRGGTPSGSKMSRTNSSAAVGGSGSGGGSGGGEGVPSDVRDRMFRERTPEPDEDFRMDEQPTAWLVKVPRFLYEGWNQLSEDDLSLGTVRVYDADHRGKQRIELLLPSAPHAPIPLPDYDPAIAGRDVKRIPRHYEVKLTAEASETMERNIFAFKEKAEEEDDDTDVDDDDDDIAEASNRPSASPASAASRKKRPKISTAFAGKVTNEAAVKPIVSSMSELASRSTTPTGIAGADSKTVLGLAGGSRGGGGSMLTPEYREILRKRKLEAMKPTRTVKMIQPDEEGTHNMLAAGMGTGALKAGQSSFIVQNKKPQQSEKYARIPKNELLDLLFSCYERYTYWTLKALREETRQPEAYLRETLSSIADQHKRGPYVGQWSLKAEYVQQRKEEEEKRAREVAAGAAGGAMGMGVDAGGAGQGQGASNGGAGDGEDDEAAMEAVI